MHRRTRRLLTVLTSALVVSPIVGGAALPASAEHTATPQQVTLVGDLQDEVGCAGDWQPACDASALEAASGTSTYSRVLELPAGTYKYKVALNGSWDENYGAGGASGGADLLVALEHPADLRFTYDHTSHEISVAPADLPGEEVTDADRALAGPALRQPTTRENFYFVMADRFANGDTANDRGGLDGDRMQHGFDPTDKGFYHGGDIAGLTEKLDYIEGLGTTAVWLTPSFKNRPVQGSGVDASAGYHGYWITDFTTIDPHFGTNAELEAFIDKAHARGIKVFFDIITNHTADVIDYEDAGDYSYISKETRAYRDAAGNEFDDADHAGENTFPALDPATSFPYVPTFRDDADRTVKEPAWLNDVTNYHNRGNSTFAGESSLYGDFVGLDDLFTEQPDVVDGMTDIYEKWVEFGIDGFRIDTVKHVNMEFWKEFAPAIARKADQVDNDDFFAFGEVYDGNPAFTSTYTTQGGLDATLDFGFQSAAVGFARGGATAGMRDFHAGDDYYTDADSNAYSLPTFLGNHDMGRIGMFLAEEASGEELLARDRLAHTLMYLTRGQPVVYYGDEQGFTGPEGDKDARQDMFASQVDEYNDDDLIGTDATAADANFDTGHPLYEHIAALAALRTQHPALADGAQVHRYASGRAGIYAFSRISSGENREYVVAVNNSGTEQTATFDTFMRQGTFRQVWPAADRRTKSDAEGRLELTVPPLSAVVLRATGTVPEPEAAPAVSFESPAPGGTVGGRQKVAADVPEGGFNQVTFAWRPAGSDVWTRLGTDDNAPYRVFHAPGELAALPDGTLVEYRALLRDSGGGLSASSSYATVGEPTADGGNGGGDGGPTEPVVQPTAVSMPGSHNSELGCIGDWAPDCDQAQMTLGDDDEVWSAHVELPAGEAFEYKAAIDKAWTENYGAGAVRNGSNIPFTVPDDGRVSFYYDHASHYVTTDAEGPLVTAAGSFQRELGCPGDWSPDCMRSWLKDIDGDGTYTFSSTQIPAGSYEVKATHGLSWNENYGAGGTPNGADIAFTVPADGVQVVFSYDIGSHVLSVTTRTARTTPDLTVAKAHWVRTALIAWNVDQPAAKDYRLHWSPDGGLVADEEAVAGGDSLPLTHDPAGLPADVLADFPHLEGYEAFRLDQRHLKQVPEILQGQLAVAAYEDGQLADATGVQIPGVLDDLYAGAAERALGVTWKRGVPSFAVWAPTAQDVDLLVWTDGAAEPVRAAMSRQPDGTWTVVGKPAWRGASYLYDVTVFAPSTGEVEHNRVTDPYSLALTTNSERSVVVDLDDPGLRPSGWADVRPPALAQDEDRNVYELHIRDFSIGDTSVPGGEQGTYLAFTRQESDGMKHLRALATAGLNTVHLLPAFDIATIEERRSAQKTPACDLDSYPADSDGQQSCVDAIRGEDGFNWGYDPYHYSAPEGSYATDAEGAGRTREFREMVKGLNEAGLQVVMDVVYNHTAASGQAARSVLDRVVPGYYHRLSATGAVERSTCCENTATEHRMMEKLMIDSVLTWAREYKVNGFRFDLMGHHSKQNMVNLREALDGLTVAKDGVDGSRIYVYGEGWNFGEVADGARFEQASQLNLGGTGIGTFSDRLRDAVRGGGPFDEDPRLLQGFASGLFTDANDAVTDSPEVQKARLLHAQDLIKLGLAGNLADFRFTSSSGEEVVGREVDYNGSPAGYAEDPSETVTYVDAHDNETLFDILTWKLPVDTSMADRVRMNTVALSTTAFSQGVVLWHAGADILRSKSLDRNSYDSGDWFNRVDWTREENTFGSGLPLAADNKSKWDWMRPLLADATLKPGPADMDTAHAAAADLLAIRMSTPLFRLGSAAAIQEKVGFPEAEPGVIAMHIDDTLGADADPDLSGVLVVFNASPSETTVASVGDGWTLHRVQAEGRDGVVKGSSAADGSVTVPARTTAVFVRR
ncbi:MAG TPA: pullulanase-type alpha-1,6-glucosidase [Nocardioidaceae bacterium]|nr:pullulanase-type alpha-1,6-glucosidase [Nocardioidaceae bacterium]